MKTDLGKRILMGIAIGAIAVGGSSAVYAAAANITESGMAAFAPQNFRGFGHKGAMAMDFSNLVSESIIDQATADKMAEYMSQMEAPQNMGRESIKPMTEAEKQTHFESNKPAERVDMFTQMAEVGIITQSQADAIKAAMPQMQMPAGDFQGRPMEKAMPMNYDNLVAKGIMDQETADKLAAFQTEKEAERKAGMDKMKSMTEEERKAHFENSKNEQPHNVWDEALSAGIITQTQADAIAEAIKEAIPQNFDGGFNAKGMGMNLDDLVTKGIIDQATADKVSEYQAKIEAERKTDMDKMKSMTEAECKAAFENTEKPQPIDQLAEMVNAGVITEAQAEAIKNAMPTHQERPMRQK